MGLDISHGCWHGAYSAFHTWRKKLAEVAGLPPLDLMEGFFKEENTFHPTFPYYLIQHDGSKDTLRRIEETLPIKWSCLKRDPLHRLLYHSDCDGHIAWRYCKPIAIRLEQLLHLLPEEDHWGHIGNWREKTQKFIDGLLLAHERKERVEFH